MGRKQVDKVNKKSAEGAELVFESIHRIMHLMRTEQYRVLRDGPHELTHLEGKVLGFFAHRPGATLRDLVEHAARDKGQLARLVRSLKDQGLLAGEGDAADRRSVRLSLTVAGRAIHESLGREVGRLSEQAIKGLSATERRQLIGLLQRIRANLAPGAEPDQAGG